MFQQIVVIGSGRVASRTLEAVLRLPNRPLVIAVEPEASLTAGLGATCRRHGIPFARIVQRDSLVTFFDNLPDRTLVLSAHNVFIFPPALVDDKRLTIINFHNSLLPRHRGRNAPSWALFERDEWAGITWHHVAAAIDEGNILCQRRIRPAWNTTALELTQTLVDLGTSALESLLPELLAGAVPSLPPDPDLIPSFHRSAEVPNQGMLDPDWPLAQVSAFLRALDFGKLPLFPQPRMRLDGSEHLITGYRFAQEAEDVSPASAVSRSAYEIQFCDRGLRLTVSLMSSAQVDKSVNEPHQPVLSRG